LSFVQKKVVQAQYFRGRDDQAYHDGNIFLPSLNNELDVVNETFINRIKSLESFAMVSFDADTMVC
jgi:hypothetical protein